MSEDVVVIKGSQEQLANLLFPQGKTLGLFLDRRDFDIDYQLTIVGSFECINAAALDPLRLYIQPNGDATISVPHLKYIVLSYDQKVQIGIITPKDIPDLTQWFDVAMVQVPIGNNTERHLNVSAFLTLLKEPEKKIQILGITNKRSHTQSMDARIKIYQDQVRQDLIKQAFLVSCEEDLEAIANYWLGLSPCSWNYMSGRMSGANFLKALVDVREEWRQFLLQRTAVKTQQDAQSIPQLSFAYLVKESLSAAASSGFQKAAGFSVWYKTPGIFMLVHVVNPAHSEDHQYTLMLPSMMVPQSLLAAAVTREDVQIERVDSLSDYIQSTAGYALIGNKDITSILQLLFQGQSCLPSRLNLLRTDQLVKRVPPRNPGFRKPCQPLHWVQEKMAKAVDFSLYDFQVLRVMLENMDIARDVVDIQNNQNALRNFRENADFGAELIAFEELLAPHRLSLDIVPSVAGPAADVQAVVAIDENIAWAQSPAIQGLMQLSNHCRALLSGNSQVARRALMILSVQFAIWRDLAAAEPALPIELQTTLTHVLDTLQQHLPWVEMSENSEIFLIYNLVKFPRAQIALLSFNESWSASSRSASYVKFQECCLKLSGQVNAWQVVLEERDQAIRSLRNVLEKTQALKAKNTLFSVELVSALDAELSVVPNVLPGHERSLLICSLLKAFVAHCRAVLKTEDKSSVYWALYMFRVQATTWQSLSTEQGINQEVRAILTDLWKTINREFSVSVIMPESPRALPLSIEPKALVRISGSYEAIVKLLIVEEFRSIYLMSAVLDQEKYKHSILKDFTRQIFLAFNEDEIRQLAIHWLEYLPATNDFIQGIFDSRIVLRCLGDAAFFPGWDEGLYYEPGQSCSFDFKYNFHQWGVAYLAGRETAGVAVYCRKGAPDQFMASKITRPNHIIADRTVTLIFPAKFVPLEFWQNEDMRRGLDVKTFDTFNGYDWQTEMDNEQVADVMSLLLQGQVCYASRLQAFEGIQPTRVYDIPATDSTPAYKFSSMTGGYYSFPAVQQALSAVDISKDLAAVEALDSAFKYWNEQSKEQFLQLFEPFSKIYQVCNYNEVLASDIGQQSKEFYNELVLFYKRLPRLVERLRLLAFSEMPHEWQRAVMILSVNFADFEILQSSEHLSAVLKQALDKLITYLQSQVLPWVLSFKLQKQRADWPTLFRPGQAMSEVDSNRSETTANVSPSVLTTTTARFHRPLGNSASAPATPRRLSDVWKPATPR